MKRFFQIFLLLTGILFSISIANASACIQESDEFVLKCTIPQKYFEQDFTCLNKDCSLRLKNKFGNYLEFYDKNKLVTIIFKNSIELNDIADKLAVIRGICQEHFEDETLDRLQSDLDKYQEHKWKFLSGEKLIIQPYDDELEEKLNESQRQSKRNHQECYEEKVEKVGNWLISSKQKKDYCDLTYQNENECFVTQVSYSKFASFLILNPSEATLLYILYIAIAVTIGYLLVKFFKDYRKVKTLKKLIKLDKRKIIITGVLIVPFLYLYGIIVKKYIEKNFYAPFLDPVLGIFLTIIGVLIVYLIATFIDHHHKAYTKKKK